MNKKYNENKKTGTGMLEKAKRNRFVGMQDVLFQALDTLNDEEKMRENSKDEIRKCTTIAKVSATLINSVRTNMEIMKLAEKKKISVDKLNETLGLSVEK